MFLGGCPCCGKKGPCWRCYGKEQSECCQTDAQGAGYQYAELIESGALPPGDSSGLTLTTDGKLQLLSMLTRTENLAGCKAARAEFGVGGVGVSGKGITVNLNWLDGSPANWKGPFVYLRYFQEGGSGFLNSTWITKATFAGKTIIGGEGCAGVCFFPDAKCNVPPNNVYPPPTFGNDPQNYDIQSIIPTDSFTGLVEIEWLFQARERDANVPDSDFVIVSEDSGTFSFEWDQVVEMAACLPCGEDPDKPADYQCFDAPPEEDGWTPIGDKCHATEEECAEECGRRCSNPCDVPGHNAGYLLGDQMLSRFFNYGDDIKSLDLRINNKRQPFFVEFESNRILRAYANSFTDPLLYNSSLNLNIDGSPTVRDYDCGYVNGFVTFEYEGDSSERSSLWILFQDFFGDQFSRPESSQFSIYGPTENADFFGNILYLNTVSFGGITWTNPYPLPPAMLTPTVVTFYDSTWCDPQNRTPVNGYTAEELVEVPVMDFAGTISGTFTVYKTDGTFLRTEDFSLQWPELISIRSCPPCPPNPGGRTMPTTTTGPGTHLKNMLAWFNIKAKEKGCGCKSMEKKMNKNGPQWCRDHMQEILDHLAKEAKKRRLPFVRLAAEKMVGLAIRKAEKDSA